VGGVFPSRGPRLLIAVALSAFAVAALPSIASAAERYASPTGGGIGCTSAVPCSLENAMKIALVEGDEVIASPGNYELHETIEDKAKITLRGVPGQPRPRLLFSGQSQHGLRLMHGSLLRDVEVDQAEDAVPAVDTAGARLDRVVVHGGEGSNDCIVNLRDAIIRDSIVVADKLPICSWADGAPDTSSYRNVTAVATQADAAIVVIATVGSSTVDLTNVIAQGGSAGGDDISVVTDIGGHATVTVTHSNFESLGQGGGNGQVIDGGGNQHDSPKFVDAATGDYRQAPGSVTIDAGINQPVNGAFDVDGDPRRIDTTDIGADEFVRPVIVSTGPATEIGPDSATLIGNVNEIGVPTSYHFEYGPTTAYGSETPAIDLGAEVTELPVAAKVDGLSPGTTYHFRLVGTNEAGAGYGHDQSFTTAPAAAPPSGSTTGSIPVFAGVSLVSRTLTLSGRFITAKVSCPAGTVGGCSGLTKLSARGRTGTRRVALGKARFSIAAGGRAKLRVRVSPAGLRRLQGVRRLRATGTNVAHDGAGMSKTTVAKVTVRRRLAR
jgi:hypothetical protein